MPQTSTHFSVVVPCDDPVGIAAKLKVDAEAVQEHGAESDIFSGDWTYGVEFEPEDGGLWLSDGGTGEGNVEAAAEAISYILSQPGSPTYVVYEWAHTCSRPIPGEIGGGVAVVTENSIRFENTWQTGDRLLKEALAEEGIT